MEVDYIIVGGGIAGCSLALELSAAGATLVLIDAQNQDTSSRVAAGLLNPIVPKRVTTGWNAVTIFKNLTEWYLGLEEKLNTSFYYPMPMVQVHASAEEAKLWRKKSENEGVHEFVFPNKASSIFGIETPFGYSEILHAGRVNVQVFCTATWDFLNSKKQVFQDVFDWNALHIENANSGRFHYKDIKAQNIVLCEGIQVSQNPFLQQLPIKPSWGDILEVSVHGNLEPNVIFKQKHWMVPLGNGNYMAGSNFLDEVGSAEQQQQDVQLILKQLRKWFPIAELIGYKRGARPVVADRRPVLGEHPDHTGMFIFNGLGTKGCSLVSWLAPIMAKHLISKSTLPEEVKISRYF